MSLQASDNFIRSLGFESYRVGGSVRDELIGRRPKDADYMIRGVEMSALGAALKQHTKFVKPLKLRDGRQAGWRVRGPKGLLEIVLPRTEVTRAIQPGENAHRAFDIVVDPQLSLEIDALRRDFTFNALFRKLSTGEVLDPTGRGLYDLERNLISTTHSDSFRDDPLRTLRALRFVARGYYLATHTAEQMREYAPYVDGLTVNGYASGTIYEEMNKILQGEEMPAALRTGFELGVLQTLFPELAPMVGFGQNSKYHDLTVDQHTLAALEVAAVSDVSLEVRWALLFHDSGKPEAYWVDDKGRSHYYSNGETEDHEVISTRLWRQAANRIGVGRELRDNVATLIKNHMVACQTVKKSKVARGRVQFGDVLYRDLLMHRACDLSGKNSSKAETMKMLENIHDMEKWRAALQRNNIPASVKDLAIDGRDMMELGLRGQDIGRVLRGVLDEVATSFGGVYLTKEWQLDRARKLK